MRRNGPGVFTLFTWSNRNNDFRSLDNRSLRERRQLTFPDSTTTTATSSLLVVPWLALRRKRVAANRHLHFPDFAHNEHFELSFRPPEFK